MAKESKTRGACVKCGKECFVECAGCFAILLEQHQQHNCPEDCVETIELCDECESNEIINVSENSENDK